MKFRSQTGLLPAAVSVGAISLALSMLSASAAAALTEPSSSLFVPPSAPPEALSDIDPANPPTEEAKEGAAQHLSDLSLGNFFSQGWSEPWQKWRRTTPDMALLRVTTNFLEREFRLDYVVTDVANNPALDSTEFLNGLIAYGLNRRLMLEVISNYQWNTPPAGPRINGAGGGFLARFQLVENVTQSYSFQARVSPPNRGIGQTQTTLTSSLAGWQDMHALIPALGRFGLYGSFQYDNFVGPHKAGAAQSDIGYDLSVAETWTAPTTPVFGNFTTFLEAFGTTLLDGASSGKTTVSLTPGIRFWFIPENSFTFGVDLPVTRAPAFHTVFRANYILNF
ncbi:MAG TPA: hypothetical protein VMQ61_09180 [Thermoanaerobaculia bacterium]|nr:hypothetical protein [Thermoanaerobaculia bacterium]